MRLKKAVLPSLLSLCSMSNADIVNAAELAQAMGITCEQGDSLRFDLSKILVNGLTQPTQHMETRDGRSDVYQKEFMTLECANCAKPNHESPENPRRVPFSGRADVYGSVDETKFHLLLSHNVERSSNKPNPVNLGTLVGSFNPQSGRWFVNYLPEGGHPGEFYIGPSHEPVGGAWTPLDCR